MTRQHCLPMGRDSCAQCGQGTEAGDGQCGFDGHDVTTESKQINRG